MKLFCLPHLGGSASIYYQWKKYLNEKIEIVPIELAGRGERIKECFYEDFSTLISDVSEKISIEENEKYAFFGHSMGALIAYELYYYMLHKDSTIPTHIFFSGRNTPEVKDEIFFGQMTDQELIDGLIQIGGIPPQLLNYPELLNLSLAVIKADRKVMQTYEFKLHTNKLLCDITVMAGKDDLTLDYGKMDEWSLITKQKCNYSYYPGAHFYVEKNLADICSLINNTLNIY